MKIAIIGAGIAGLTAAYELEKQGGNVELFEQSNAPGGRLCYQQLPWGRPDMGAQYFTARDPRFQQQVAAWQHEGLVKLWSFTPFRVSKEGVQPSPDDTQRYVGTPSMASIAKQLAGNLSVHYGTEVVALNQLAGHWSISTAGGKAFNEYDWIILSAPAEQSKSLVRDYPSVAQQIPDAMHQPCRALALATRGAVDNDIQGIFGDDMVSWVSRLSARPQPSCARIQHPDSDHYDDLWMLHFSGPWSVDHQDDSALTQRGLQWLNRVLRNTLPAPLKAIQSVEKYWRYARLAPQHPPASIIVDDSARIAVIGDWCCGGRIEGAYLSALELVDRGLS